jgi:exportin-T
VQGPPGSQPQHAQQQQQQQQQQVSVTLEDAREKGELQRALYSLLLGLAMNNLSGALLAVPPSVLDAAMTAVAKGAASHVDPAVRRTCIQVCVCVCVCVCVRARASALSAAAAWCCL